MLLGRDVMERFVGVRAAVQSREVLAFYYVSCSSVYKASLPPKVVPQIMNMLLQTKKNGTTCASLLLELSEAATFHPGPKVIPIPSGMLCHDNSDHFYSHPLLRRPKDTNKTPVLHWLTRSLFYTKRQAYRILFVLA